MRKDLTGQKFGRLTVLEVSGKTKNRGLIWRCLCECGKVSEVSASSLVTKNTQSCGCLHRERITKHKISRTVEYKAYGHMMSRCYNPDDKNYHNYGGRGITVCQRWQDNPKAFFDDMGPRPKGMELERVDNDGNYEPLNCVWATHYSQARNRRTNDKYLYNGVMTCLKDICKELNLPYTTIQSRIKRFGWSLDESLNRVIKIGNNQCSAY
jgi:hypothetical protein